MDLEFKSLQLEIKEINEKGVFKGVASPFNNVDYGNDRVLPTVAKRNNSKVVPYLWQHNPHEPVGEVKLIANNNGIDIEGKLYLDVLENGNPTIPNAYKAYTLMKNKKLKNSIGYKTLEYEYTTEGKKTVRNLKDIDILEVSAVTFPMNEKAAITDVKQEGGNKVEEKAMSFGEVLNLRKANENRWQLMDALNISFRQLMEDSEMKVEEKINQLNKNVDEFATAYKDVMVTILKAKASGKKGIEDILETKEDGELETKAGAKISKANKEKLKSTLKAIKEILGDDEETEEEDEEEKAEGKKPKEEEKPKEKGKEPKKQEKENDDKIELKADEIEALEGLYKNMIESKEE